jgi:YfiH family protein
VAVTGSGSLEFIRPQWDAPRHVQAAVTTRAGGVSGGACSALNLAAHVGDESAAVQANRERLAAALSLPSAPRWLTQVHGTHLVCADNSVAPVTADAAWTQTIGTVCVVLTADCLPLLLTDRAGSRVAAVHAGWRGMCDGVIERSVFDFVAAGIVAADILAWLGPAISPANYEVDTPVRDAFVARDAGFATSFALTRAGHWQFDLYATARQILESLGVANISGGDHCTYADERLFSYRREQGCGRQAALIWLTEGN